MIKVIIPKNPEFDLYKDRLRELYKQNQDKICDTNDFEFIIHNTLFYCFFDDGALVGAIYFFLDDGKLFLNAFGKRKNFIEKVECLKLSTTWFNCDIYAVAQNRASALCLLRAGFEREKDKLFIYKNGFLPGKD